MTTSLVDCFIQQQRKWSKQNKKKTNERLYKQYSYRLSMVHLPVISWCATVPHTDWHSSRHQRKCCQYHLVTRLNTQCLLTSVSSVVFFISCFPYLFQSQYSYKLVTYSVVAIKVQTQVMTITVTQRRKSRARAEK